MQGMQRVFAIIGLMCCAVSMGRANEAPQTWVNTVDTNAMERVLLNPWVPVNQFRVASWELT